MSEALSAAKAAFKSIATEGLVAAYGEQKGNAIGFLLFGGYGVPGLLDDTELVVEAIGADDPNKVAEKFARDAAAALAQDLAKLVLQEGLKKAGIAVTTFAEVSASFFAVLLQPVALGNGELPADLRKAMQNRTGIQPHIGGLPPLPDTPAPLPPRPAPAPQPPIPSPTPRPPAPSPAPDAPDVPDRPFPRPRPTPPTPPVPTPAPNPEPAPKGPPPSPPAPPEPPPQAPIPIPKAADIAGGDVDIRPELQRGEDRNRHGDG